MKTLLARLLTEEDGATLIEYVLVLALIALVAASVLTGEDSGLRPTLRNHFDAKAQPLNPAGR